MSRPTCGSCRFFEETEPLPPVVPGQPQILMGRCRRRAPEYNGTSQFARWPEVRREYDWCGEHIPSGALTMDEYIADSLATIATAARDWPR